MDFLDAGAFVGLSASREGRQKAAEFHPGGFAQKDGPRRVVRVDELM